MNKIQFDTKTKRIKKIQQNFETNKSHSMQKSRAFRVHGKSVQTNT